MLKNVAAALSGLSLIVAPVAASAAPAFDGIRADSSASGEMRLGEAGGGSWLLILLGAAAVIGAIIIIADDGDDSPTSP